MTNKCKLSVGSVTIAEKAMRTLASAAIYSEIIKIDGSTGRGCVYGIEFGCSSADEVKLLLRRAGIKAKDPYADKGSQTI